MGIGGILNWRYCVTRENHCCLIWAASDGQHPRWALGANSLGPLWLPHIDELVAGSAGSLYWVHLAVKGYSPWNFGVGSPCPTIVAVSRTSSWKKVHLLWGSHIALVNCPVRAASTNTPWCSAGDVNGEFAHLKEWFDVILIVYGCSSFSSGWDCYFQA